MKKLLLLASFLLACLPVLHAAKTGNFAIFESSVYTINPGMDAVLVLTPDQQARIQAANEAWKNDPELKATQEAFSQSKNAAPEQASAAKGAYYSAQKVARAKYDEALAGILSGEQKTLVESLNSFAKDVAKEAGSEGTWAERMTRLKELGNKRLGDVLTPAQIQILSAAPATE